MKGKMAQLINCLLLLFFIVSALTAIILFFFTATRYNGASFLGIAKKDLVLWHSYFGILFIAVALMHIAMHCKQCFCMLKPASKSGEKHKK